MGVGGGATLSLLEIRVSVGYACNLRCAHCYSVESTEGDYGLASGLDSRLLTLADYELLITSLHRDLGLRTLSITGGEPFYAPLSGTTLGLARLALPLGLNLRVSTNGIFLTPAMCAELAALAPDRAQILLQVSLDGASAETHDSQRQSPGAFLAAVAGIRASLDAGLRVRVRYTLSQQNLHELGPCLELCRDLGVETVVVKPVVPTGLGPRQTALVPSDREVREAGRLLPGGSPHPCTCGTSSLHLTPVGDLFPCGYLAGADPLPQWCIGNIRAFGRDLTRSWRGSPVLQAFRALLATTHCPGARIRQMVQQGGV